MLYSIHKTGNLESILQPLQAAHLYLLYIVLGPEELSTPRGISQCKFSGERAQRKLSKKERSGCFSPFFLPSLQRELVCN